MTAQPIGAGAALPRLAHALERSGWGDLAGPDLGGVRRVLGVLGRLLDPKHATGRWTVEQLAAAAGLSPRWTASRLVLLEDLELVRWDRGGVVAGRPVPSLFRVDKRRLSALVNSARKLRDAATLRVALETRARIAALRVHNLKRNPRNRRSVHVELTSTLPLTGSIPRPPQAAGDPPEPSPGGSPVPVDRQRDYLARMRAQVRAARVPG